MPSFESSASDQRLVPPPDPGTPPTAEPPGRQTRRGPRHRALVLGLCALIIAAVAGVLILGNGSKNHPSTRAALLGNASNNRTPSPAPAPTPQSAPTSSAPLPKPAARISLVSPTGAKGTVGLAAVLRRGTTAAIAIVGRGVRANDKHNAYAVWLYNSPNDAVRLGFVNPGVGRNGHLDTAGGLPVNAGHFKQLLVTLETTANPISPGRVILEGTMAGV